MMDQEESRVLTGARSVALQLINGLGASASPWFRKGLLGFTVTSTIHATAKHWKAQKLQERIYTVAVPADDVIYPDVHRWVLDNLSNEQRRAVVARSTSPNSSYEASGSGEPNRLKLFYDGSRAQDIEIDGHVVVVVVERPEASVNERLARYRQDRVVFTCHSSEARDAVLEFLKDVTETTAEQRPRLYVATRWGHWRNDSEVPLRSLDTVVLRAGQKEAILADMEAFLRNEPQYIAWGLPYHRGYLFHGVAGSGKTSTASALASHLGLDAYYVSLGSLENDASLGELLAEVKPRSVLLLEDIDIVHGTKARDDAEGKGVTLAGLLNTLDGFVTPHGVITILTTNNRAVLDEALIRPGRVDMDECMGYLDAPQLEAMMNQFLSPEVTWKLRHIPRDVTPAEIIGVLKEHMHDKVAAAHAVREFLGLVSRNETKVSSG